MDDYELIRQYVEHGSPDAFGELVRRHIGLVYSAALRQMRDPHDAQDVTQGVFIALARDAHKLRRQQVLAGWLSTATRYLALNARKSASRRRDHERRAAELANTMNNQTDTPAWEQIAPELDEAMAQLKPRARDAVLLRYFQGKSVRETAEALGITEDAAKRRLSRALEQLRGLFRRRGISVSLVALATLLTTHSVHAVPPALVAATTAASIKFASAATLQKGTVTLMSLLKTKAAVGLLALTVTGTTGVVVHHALARAPIAADAPAKPAVLLADASAKPLQAQEDTGKAAPWRKRFDEVYHLDEGQDLRRVPPPFIPERTAYFNAIDAGGFMLDPTADAMTVFTYEGEMAEFNLFTRGAPTVSSVMGSMVGIPSYKLEMKLKDGLRPLPGDWVIRKSLPEDKKIEALGKILRDELKWKIHFEKRSAEHDVIVASGAFTPPKDNPDHMVDVFIDAKPNGGASAGGLDGFLRALGELCNTETIDEATAPPTNGVFWRVHTGSNLSREQADKMLANVTAQTGLQFKHTRKVTSHWVAVQD
ncbi:MAG: hypothetical protein JWN51_3488 [Phycisphaerales bacterium]|nr:hypothetical protein [Phycisphaerales bacterium]